MEKGIIGKLIRRYVIYWYEEHFCANFLCAMGSNFKIVPERFGLSFKRIFAESHLRGTMVTILVASRGAGHKNKGGRNFEEILHSALSCIPVKLEAWVQIPHETQFFRVVSWRTSPLILILFLASVDYFLR